MAAFDPKEEMRRLQETMKKFLLKFNDPFSKNMRKNLMDFKQPQSFISQGEKKVTINVELPKIKQKEVMLNITKKFVEIRAEKKKRSVKRRKQPYSSNETSEVFYRVISLPAGFDHKKAKAVFKKNILKIDIPRIKEKKRKR